MLKPELPYYDDPEGSRIPNGFDETMQYRLLIEKYDNLWTDTTMVITDYFPMKETIDLSRYRLDRVMYGSDFPNIPYE